MKLNPSLPALLSIALGLAACTGAGPSSSPGSMSGPGAVTPPAPLDAQACAALQGRSIAARLIGGEAASSLTRGARSAPTSGFGSGDARVSSATWHAASPVSIAPQGPTPAARVNPALPDHCRVLGEIAAVDPKAQPIQFQVNLPARWNGRSVQFGGGGFNGVLINALALVPGQRYDLPAPLALGFVTVGTDSGHQGQPGQPPMSFALNEEMLVNFAHASYPKVRNLSVALMQQAYGRAPERLYFVGSSEGGREGLTMAQRYPFAFDGIFSRVPVIHWTGLQFAGARNGMALMNGGWLNPEEVKLVHEASLAQCDGADGLADGIIANTRACLRSLNLQPMRCRPGESVRCLSAAQAEAVRVLRQPYDFPFALANGLTRYPGWSVGGENTAAFGPTGGWLSWWTGRAAPTVPPLPANGIAWFYGSGALQYFYARDPKADPRSITPQAHAARVREVSALMDSTDPDLSAFHARGGKLIVMEHMADYAQSPLAGLEYTERVRQTLGEARSQQFLRVYAAPGVDHVGSGAPALFDPLGVLTQWVEKGQAPGALAVIDQGLDASLPVLRERPLCEWPRWPAYRGGDASKAASFACTE